MMTYLDETSWAEICKLPTPETEQLVGLADFLGRNGVEVRSSPVLNDLIFVRVSDLAYTTLSFPMKNAGDAIRSLEEGLGLK